MAYAGKTHRGLVRPTNQDRFGMFPELGLFVVADGMGGAAAGEVAAQMAVDLVSAPFTDLDVTWPGGSTVPDGVGRELLVAAINYANNRIHGRAIQEFTCHGMGTTFAGILALEDRLVIAHVGDSRVYRFRDRQLDLLTEDHSLLNDFIRRGKWNPAEADVFPHRNIITRAVGADEELEVDTRIEELQPGDVYVICSDGLHGMVDHRQIASVLHKHQDLTVAAARLIDLANDKGGLDNITAVLVRVTGTGAR
jgi:PPM family protein phosphatase